MLNKEELEKLLDTTSFDAQIMYYYVLYEQEKDMDKKMIILKKIQELLENNDD